MAAKKNHEEDMQECYLLAAVCDVRGFSTLQARIDDFLVSRFTTGGRSHELARANSGYMRSTRKRAEKLFSDCLKEPLSSSPNYAIKSTGDGFLVAVELPVSFQALGDNTLDATGFKPEWVALAKALAEALLKIFEDSYSIVPDTLGHTTRDFIDKYGNELGLAFPSKGEFYIPGSIAMGSGALTPAGKAFDKGNGNRGDAHGHTVNVAFRLCDKAGRFDDKKNNCSPPVLLDRRVGRMLVNSGIEQIDEYKLKSGHPVELKGIEEHWCFAFEKPEQPGTTGEPIGP